MEKLRQFGRDAAALYLKWSPLIAGTLILFLVLFFIGAYCAGLGNILTSSITIGWVTAVATFAAAVVALRVASANNLRLEAREQQAAELYVATLPGLVGIINFQLSEIARKTKSSAGDSVGLRNKYIEIKATVDSIDFQKVFTYSPAMAANLGMIANHVRMFAINPNSWADTIKLLAKYLAPVRAASDALVEEASSARAEKFDAYLPPESPADGSVATDAGTPK
ncbi:hypothetical protein [Achromobacter sp. DH1f]|uniref:hypothetical protein n=1 Tax=Achromobacter sp. DH1f TaxID=1397275 RepID=UPI000469D600|nr:hypothetical protein [Achromobacter sp. DH1f]